MVLEVLAIFELSRSTSAFHHASCIKFQVFSALHRMSLTKFSIHLGLYDAKFTRTIAYDALLTSRLEGEPLTDAWRWLSFSSTYDPHRTKAIALQSPVV